MLLTYSFTFFVLVQRINFESDWKLITVFIGGNDLCDHCYNSVSTDGEVITHKSKGTL